MNKYANIVCTISLALFFLLWGIVNTRLSDVENRLRSIELKITAMCVHLGIDETLKSSTTALAGSQAVENQ